MLTFKLHHEATEIFMIKFKSRFTMIQFYSKYSDIINKGAIIVTSRFEVNNFFESFYVNVPSRMRDNWLGTTINWVIPPLCSLIV